VHDYGKLPDGRPFLAMKLIKGRTLDELLSERGNPAAERGRFVAVFEQVCQAVAYPHAHNVIHRDLKPGNVMVGSFGEVQVMDWGLAKVLTGAAAPTSPDAAPGETVGGTIIYGSDGDGSDASFTQAGSILGTLAYMPPEQAAGEIHTVDQRSDVFGLGAILTVILTGKPPYFGPDSEVVRVMAIRGNLAACLARLDGCGAEPELVALCKRCLAFQQADRPRHAGTVAEEVASLRTATEERARKAEMERAAAQVKAAEQRKRRRWQVAVAAAIVLILALLGIGAWRLDHQAAERDKERAVAAERDRQEVMAALANADEALGAGDLAAADTALALAGSRLGDHGPADLSTLLAAARRDRDLVYDMREIGDLSRTPPHISTGRLREPAVLAGRYRAAFARYGIDLDRADPEAATWARVAVALRPDNPFAHVLLGDVWKQLHHGAEAEAALRRAIELAGKYPKYVGAHLNLGNVLLDRGELEGAEASYRTAIAIDPSIASLHYNLGLLRNKRGDLAGAEQCLRKAVAADPTDAGVREILDQIVRKRARMDELVAGRANPASPEEEVELAEFAYRSPQRRCLLAVRFYSHAFAVRSALADDLVQEHRYNAACTAALAAAGKGEKRIAFGGEEWGYLTGLALKWLRADLARWASLAKDPKQIQKGRERLSRWKKEPALASVRDPAWLGAMPPPDRQAWESLWRDVDALLASVSPQTGSAPDKP
jgi:tetratricopeptide (TPR) repeat protein